MIFYLCSGLASNSSHALTFSSAEISLFIRSKIVLIPYLLKWIVFANAVSWIAFVDDLRIGFMLPNVK